MNAQQCCSGACTNGLCGKCQPDGSACKSAAECCTGSCTAGVCGAPLCPLSGQPCADCMATKCCNQAASCFNDPQCLSDVTCFLQCAQGGSGLPQCFFKCVKSPLATQILVCLGQNCGVGTCF
jgi:hypothetical protein